MKFFTENQVFSSSAVSDLQAIHVLNLYFLGNSMNNLPSYCGLTDSRMRASDTDLPVYKLSNLFRKSYSIYASYVPGM